MLKLSWYSFTSLCLLKAGFRINVMDRKQVAGSVFEIEIFI